MASDVLGPVENIRKLKSADFRRYMSKHYTARNMVISLAGDLRPEAALIKIEQHFGNIARGQATAPKPIQNKQRKREIALLSKNLEQGHLLLAYRAFGLHDRRKPILDILMNVLGSGMSSRLFTEVREKRGLAYAISGGADYYSDAGYAYIQGGLNKEKMPEAISAIKEVLQQIINEPVDIAELNRAKEYIKGKLFYSLDGVAKTAGWYGAQKILNPKGMDYHRYLKKLDTVGAREVQRLAADIFRSETETLILHGPYKNKEKFAKILARYDK